MIIKITIPEIPPSNNKYIGRNARWEYKEEKTRWEWLIKAAAKIRPTNPINKAVVLIEYYFPDKRRRDPDNYSGKMLLDAIVRCGILADDSFENIRLELSGKYDKAKPRTEINVTEETPCD